METREQAILKLHADLAHEGAASDCVKCDNLATNLGWDINATKMVNDMFRADSEWLTEMAEEEIKRRDAEKTLRIICGKLVPSDLKAGRRKCEECGKVKPSVVLRSDPYDEDVLNTVTKRYLCDECEKTIAREI